MKVRKSVRNITASQLKRICKVVTHLSKIEEATDRLFAEIEATNIRYDKAIKAIVRKKKQEGNKPG